LKRKTDLPAGTRALIFSKYYYGVLTKRLEGLEIDRYFSVLYFLLENSGTPQQYICNHLAIDKTAMVKVMNYLIASGYVSRKPNPKDRREQFVFLTAKGKKRTQEIHRVFNDLEKQIFSGISNKSKVIFDQVLSELTEKLVEQPFNDLFFNYKRTKK
jgi:DNA-binding MarR family transcriptional regulator